MTDYGENRLQVRCQYDTNRIHIQGVGQPTVNRKYGIAIELRAPPVLTDWLSLQEPWKKSPASGSMLYVPMTVVSYNDGETIQFLIDGEELNHPQGVMLNVNADSLPVKTLVAFAKEADANFTESTVTPYVTDEIQQPIGGEEE
jgi:hypothetical protein|tara:strand:- start:4090 stop:4521 length:432 start_codon:yes stop_codon:yes gene_type:complete